MKRSIPWAKPKFYGKEKIYLADALESTWVSGGYYVEKFEKEFTQRNGSKYGITTANGTTALQLAILALGIGPGNEVVVPGFTFVAPANMVIKAGATPVYADIDPSTWCIDANSVIKYVTNRTKAIIAVHVYGNVCDMEILKDLAVEKSLCIIEDTAEAAFSKYKGKYAGTFGNAGCFSFQATKSISMGEGGFVLTNDKDLYERMRIIRNHGMREGKRYWHDIVGYNFRLTNLQAAVGCGQLENIDNIILERKRIYQLYCKHLAKEEGIRFQYFKPEVDPVVWAIAIKIDPHYFRGDRDFLIKSMLEFGIETRPGFYPFSVMPLYNAPSLPVSEDVGAHVISLPFSPSLTEEEIIFICDQFKKLKK